MQELAAVHNLNLSQIYLYKCSFARYNPLMTDDGLLCEKIVRLACERGWNQEEFARKADLNRLTIRGIFQGPPRKPHNATIQACAIRAMPHHRLRYQRNTPKNR